MGRIIAVANQKGGVGKTTTAINLSSSLVELGKKVLTIDMDPQGNTTSGLGIDKNDVDATVYELILDEATIEESVNESIMEGLDVIASNINLSGAEVELISIENKEFLLKEKINPIKDNYDFIIIDCPPSLNLLTINAMTTAIMISAPVLLVSIVVGLAISIFQATTHIQEQTLTFVPKVLAIMGVLILFGPWMITVLTTYVRNLYMSMNTLFL